MRLKVSEVAERYLEQWLDAVMRGELALWALPPSVASYYYAGFNEAWALAKHQALEYEHKLDLAYMQLVTPKERQAEYERRLQMYFEAEYARFFGGVDGEGYGSGRVRRWAA